jgi:hypothetical protein
MPRRAPEACGLLYSAERACICEGAPAAGGSAIESATGLSAQLRTGALTAGAGESGLTRYSEVPTQQPMGVLTAYSQERVSNAYSTRAYPGISMAWQGRAGQGAQGGAARPHGTSASTKTVLGLSAGRSNLTITPHLLHTEASSTRCIAAAALS